MQLTDIAGLIQTAGIAVFGTDLFCGRMPEDPATAIALDSYGGRPREQTHDGSIRRFPRVRVIVRDTDMQAAIATADAIWVLFNATRDMDDTQLLINGTQYEVITPLGEPTLITTDTSGRSLLAANYEVRWAS